MQNFTRRNDVMLDIHIGVLENRYAKPFFALLDEFGIKFVFASGTTFFLEKILPPLYKVVDTDIQLIYSLAILIILDLITGIWSSVKKNKPITSLGLRSSVVKVVEYIFLLLPLTILSNMDEYLNWVQTWAYVFVCATEIKSIGENVFSRNSDSKTILNKFWEVLKQKNDVDVK